MKSIGGRASAVKFPFCDSESDFGFFAEGEGEQRCGRARDCAGDALCSPPPERAKGATSLICFSHALSRPGPLCPSARPSARPSDSVSAHFLLLLLLYSLSPPNSLSQSFLLSTAYSVHPHLVVVTHAFENPTTREEILPRKESSKMKISRGRGREGELVQSQSDFHFATNSAWQKSFPGCDMIYTQDAIAG